VVAQGIVDGNAAAEQWGCALAIESFRDGKDEARAGADTVSISAVAMDAGAFSGGAEVLKAADAPLALAAGVGLPAEADALALLEILDFRAYSRDIADDLVTGDG